MKRYILILILLVAILAMQAQESTYQQIYRKKVLEYNQDIKASKLQTSIQAELEKAALADFKPKLSAEGSFGYTGNPLELTMKLPDNTVTFKGDHSKYGASISLSQPVYTGGTIKANYKKAQNEKELSENDSKRITHNILYDADMYYWQAVARQELVGVAESFRESVRKLVEVVKHRVDVKYTDKNDLLMAEVKLNEADYQLLQSKNNKEVSRMVLFSFAGIVSNETFTIDSTVIAINQPTMNKSLDPAIGQRPEMKMAENKIEIQKSVRKIANAQFMPKLQIGIDGSYSSPGYNFKPDIDPNYAIYANLSIPIFEWGKRKNTRKAADYSIHIAQENRNKVEDNIKLEIQTAYYNYTQAIEKVNLTESSLEKSKESEEMAMESYKEGKISIVEVINAQIYHQQAQINYIQSKLNAQIARSAFARATGDIYESIE